MYYFLIKLMFDFNWRQNYLTDNKGNNPKVEEFHQRIAEIAPELYQRLDDEGWGRTGFDIWENMYSFTIYALCFGSHIPVHVSTRVLEWVLFMDNEDHSLVILIVYMLKICETRILNFTDSRERF